MTPLAAGAAALAVLAVVLVAGGWRLVVLDRDVMRLDEELGRLHDELRTVQHHVRTSEERLRDTAILAQRIKHYLEWLDPWIQYWLGSWERR